MINSDIIKHIGEFNIKVIQNGEVVEEVDFTNLITNAYLDELAKVVQGQTTDLEIKYLAIGDDNTTPTATDTNLGNELFRKQVTSQDKTGTGEVTTIFVVIDSEAVFEWQEIGVFAGSTATASADTGVLISRVLYNRDKTNLEELQVTRKELYRRA